MSKLDEMAEARQRRLTNLNVWEARRVAAKERRAVDDSDFASVLADIVICAPYWPPTVHAHEARSEARFLARCAKGRD